MGPRDRGQPGGASEGERGDLCTRGIWSSNTAFLLDCAGGSSCFPGGSGLEVIWCAARVDAVLFQGGREVFHREDGALTTLLVCDTRTRISRERVSSLLGSAEEGSFRGRSRPATEWRMLAGTDLAFPCTGSCCGCCACCPWCRRCRRRRRGSTSGGGARRGRSGRSGGGRGGGSAPAARSGCGPRAGVLERVARDGRDEPLRGEADEAFPVSGVRFGSGVVSVLGEHFLGWERRGN